MTGAHGLLGRCLLQADTDAELLGCGRGSEPAEGRPYRAVDLADPAAAAALVGEVRPDWVIHTAALTNVDLCETDPELGRQVNVDLVANLARACEATGCGLAQLSTDYVFDGTSGPYGESDEPAPLSQYGRQKLESEGIVLGADTAGLVVRTLWLYGHVGGGRRNLVTWPIETLARGERLRIVDDQWGNPTYVRDLAAMLLVLCERGATGLYHVGGASFMTRYELVLELAGIFGMDASLVESMTTVEARQDAPRPRRSGLRYDAVAEVLDRTPATLAEGIERLRTEPEFQRDFPALAQVRSDG